MVQVGERDGDAAVSGTPREPAHGESDGDGFVDVDGSVGNIRLGLCSWGNNGNRLHVDRLHQKRRINPYRYARWAGADVTRILPPVTEDIPGYGGSGSHRGRGIMVVPRPSSGNADPPGLGAGRQEMLQSEVGRIGGVAGRRHRMALDTTVAPVGEDVAVLPHRLGIRNV